MPRAVRITLLLLAGILVVAAIVLAVLYHASQQVPEFYREAMTIAPATQEKASERMIQRSTTLHSQVQHEGQWQGTFTAEDINGWLAVDLPRNHKDLLPPGFHDPRVRIAPDGMTLACQLDRGRLHTVVSLELSVYMESANVVALRFRKARAGAIPWPVDSVVRSISDAVQQAKWRIRRAQAAGDPVILVSPPPFEDKHQRVVRIDSARLEPEAIVFVGATERPKK